MTRPANLPRWAVTALDVESADITEPTSGEKDVGWQAGRPSRQVMNWLQVRAYQWAKYLDEVAHALWPATIGYVSGAGWTVDAGSIRVTTATNGAGWHVPFRVAAGHVLNLADLDWRVKPGGATNVVTCGIAIYNDGGAQLAASKASSAGAVAETVNGAGATVTIGAFPYTVAAGDVAIASFVATGGGAGTREAYWFKHTPA